MNMQSREYIGVLADENEADGRNNVFINKGEHIQYRVKSLLLPSKSPTFVSGFISSFEDDYAINDDEYSSDESRIENFKAEVKNKLFIYSYKINEGGHANMLSRKANLVNKPPKFENNTKYYAIPVFCSRYNKDILEWVNDRNCKLFRDYTNKEEFIKLLRDKKSVGSIYGYDTDAFIPSFIVWMEEDGSMHAIGHTSDCKENAQGGIIFDCEKIGMIDISNYDEYWVYQVSLNPTIMYLPEDIYTKIEDQLLKQLSMEEGIDKISLEHKKVEKELTGIELNVRSESEEGIEIDTTQKNDELIITSMDYYSQKRKDPLFYNMKDFVNIHTALKCNSLVILSGLSGTGKSAIVDIYAKALGINTNIDNSDENRLLFIPVRPSWNDDSDLLGYVDLVHMVYRASDSGFVDFLVRSQKDENKDKIFIVCFDEMNLARVEHYFSKFLSLLEQPIENRELQLYDKQYRGRLYNSVDYPYKITIGDNIKFVGTVNVDESTYHFSDKVLDRANVIQLDVLNYAKEWEKKKYRSLVNTNWSMDDYNSIIITNSEKDMGRVHQLLWDIHTLLHSVSSKYGVGPRVVKNIDMYLWNLPKSSIGNFTFATGIDLQIAQRVLTKVRGPENQLGEILSEKSPKNIYQIFDDYQDLSGFNLCREIVVQKQRELESYGYCI